MIKQTKRKRKFIGRLSIGKKLSSKHKIKYAEANQFINNTIAEMEKVLKRGEEIKLPNFGVFFVQHKAERMGRNPKTMEPFIISERKVVRLRYCKPLRNRIIGKNS